jgi:hypothetical protein
MDMFEYLTKEDKKNGTSSAYEYLVKIKGEKYAKQTFNAAKKHRNRGSASSGGMEIHPAVFFILGLLIGYVGAMFQYAPNTFNEIIQNIQNIKF